MLRTNSKKYLKNIQTYLINAIDSEGYENHPKTDKEKVSFLFECYNSEYNHAYNVKRYPNEQERLGKWLEGHTVLKIPYCYSGILELAKELQEVEAYDKKTEERICQNYFSFMAYHILKLNKQS